MKCKDSRDGRRHHQEINVAAKTLEIKLEEMLPLKIAYRYFFYGFPILPLESRKFHKQIRLIIRSLKCL